MRHLSSIDRLIARVDDAFNPSKSAIIGTGRTHPHGDASIEEALADAERQLSASLMRVNHAGEIAAQALYQGQTLTARSNEIREKLRQSAVEEQDHLIWCKQRVEELGENTSRLEPFWHWGSVSIGAIAGLAGDAWSLGFIKETEDQVIEHLKGHLDRLPAADNRSRAIIEQMIIDEAEHGDTAVQAGGRPLPAPVKRVMKLTARVMTQLSYRY